MPSRFWRASGNALLLSANVLGPAGGGGGATWTAATDWTLSNTLANPLTANRSANTVAWRPIIGSTAKTSGTIIFTIDAIGSGTLHVVGLGTGGDTVYPGQDSTGKYGIGYRSDGVVDFCGNGIGSLATWTTADVIKVIRAGDSVSFYKNNALQTTVDMSSGAFGISAGSPVRAGGTYFSGSDDNGTGMQITVDVSSW